VSSAKFISMRPPRTLSRLIANAAKVATMSVSSPVPKAMMTLLPNWLQK
jgi:hypothetical protein